MSADLNRRDILAGTIALGAIGSIETAGAQPAAAAAQQQASKTMSSYIGTPTSRVDGRAKVTGQAKYAGEFNVSGLAYGSVVGSTITKGRIVRIDTADVLKVPGVLGVLTHDNRPRMADNDKAYSDAAAPEGSPYRPLYDDKVLFNGQPVAVVLAEDWDTARYAATLVRVEYRAEDHVTDLHFARDKAFVVEKPQKPRGDAAKAFAAAAVRHEAEYFIPIEHHNPMELFASTVVWNGDGKLTVYDKTQGVQNVQSYLCGVFGLKPEDVTVMSPFMGGGFGAGLRPQYQVVLAVLGALSLKRPVRLVLNRAQMYGLCYRPATIEFSRHDTGWSEQLYKSANASYSHKLVRVDLPTSGDMRAPGAAPGVYALESAMDELAVALRLDPLELRLRCYSERDQQGDLPFTSKALRECYRQGAEAFGWAKRSPQPRSMRDGNDLVGWGMATGIWEALQVPASARIVLTANGHAEVATAASDIGTGTYTIMAQVTADTMGLPIENVTVKLGDSTLPPCPLEGGSWIAASVSHAIVGAADEVRSELLRIAKTMTGTPFADAAAADVILADGKLARKGDSARSAAVADIMRHGKVERIERRKDHAFADISKYARNTHSAVFVEVKVDDEIGIIRVTRVVTAVAAGRILNPKTAGNQIVGSVVGGIGMALHEETLIDHRYGRIMNANIAEYHVPVHADVHDIQVIFVDEPDSIINPLGMKGVGEIGIVGVAAAVANAVYHATGKRVRELPITLDKL